MAKKRIKTITTITETTSEHKGKHKKGETSHKKSAAHPHKKVRRKVVHKSHPAHLTVHKKPDVEKKILDKLEDIEQITKKVTKLEGKNIKRKSTKKASEKLENQILQNLIALQKVNVNLAEKFEALAEQISNLLALFEMTARSFASQPHVKVTERDKEFLDKIDKLLEQNKTIAKGLTLMEQKMREKLYGPIIRPQERVQQQKGYPPL